jgi:hypothetical protein
MMTKTGIDQDALIQMFSAATARQGEALREAVSTALLQALQGRELTLKNMRAAVRAVTEATSAGLAKNKAPAGDLESMLEKAFAGMDAALLQAVEANRRALAQLVDRGAELGAKPMKAAVDQVEQIEDMFFKAVSKAAESAGNLQGPWNQVLEKMHVKGTQAGAQAASMGEMLGQAREHMRATRASSLKATEALMDSYTALVSGVLIGMSQALQASAAVGEHGGAPAAGQSPRTGGGPRRTPR